MADVLAAKLPADPIEVPQNWGELQRVLTMIRNGGYAEVSGRMADEDPERYTRIQNLHFQIFAQGGRQMDDAERLPDDLSRLVTQLLDELGVLLRKESKGVASSIGTKITGTLARLRSMFGRGTNGEE